MAIPRTDDLTCSLSSESLVNNAQAQHPPNLHSSSPTFRVYAIATLFSLTSQRQSFERCTLEATRGCRSDRAEAYFRYIKVINNENKVPKRSERGVGEGKERRVVHRNPQPLDETHQRRLLFHMYFLRKCGWLVHGNLKLKQYGRQKEGFDGSNESCQLVMSLVRDCSLSVLQTITLA
ncbi:hypothetical protein EVAR_79033_1 [Eumeta japonica]|uniref:Uncharacterized protein n=1 Tax=Eumeta variegata TaxID=151549 RepID=A0A4C1XT59_EUMVA|nr:hypothetical protein EVAR_79033_1 [Eumeta japonica]